ncbi:STAS/SEC14 domain-containing protein [Jannaschia sp. Os4]|uniref:STAS/SEC14 domain-containing protein n=1 Tax=Jannaschia sp. Os4 TaxID=2807617 RepID=UPI0019394E55|nr:STAS/SEC14 domain-containing protein [Jannaschia sp. Os4]MBM2577392.1 STAS/SEC14 domain-containing protein [Jannaschia sp. Os4]
MLRAGAIREVGTDRADLFAFRIDGEVSRDDMAAMGERMLAVFEAAPGPVDMLLIFDRYEGSETFAGLSWPAVRSRVESLGHVRRYVVAGAPDGAARMVEAMGALIPVEADAVADEAAAWALLGARPV